MAKEDSLYHEYLSKLHRAGFMTGDANRVAKQLADAKLLPQKEAESKELIEGLKKDLVKYGIKADWKSI